MQKEYCTQHINLMVAVMINQVSISDRSYGKQKRSLSIRPWEAGGGGEGGGDRERRGGRLRRREEENYRTSDIAHRKFQCYKYLFFHSNLCDRLLFCNNGTRRVGFKT